MKASDVPSTTRQAAVAQARRAVNARRLKDPPSPTSLRVKRRRVERLGWTSREVDFFFMDHGCRGSKSLEGGFTSADANRYGLACQRFTARLSREITTQAQMSALLCDRTHARSRGPRPRLQLINDHGLQASAESGEGAESDGAWA